MFSQTKQLIEKINGRLIEYVNNCSLKPYSKMRRCENTCKKTDERHRNKVDTVRSVNIAHSFICESAVKHSDSRPGSIFKLQLV